MTLARLLAVQRQSFRANEKWVLAQTIMLPASVMEEKKMTTAVSKISNRTNRWRAWANPAAMFALAITLGVALSGFSVASAQNQRTYQRSDVERFIRDVEASSKEFQRDFDTWLDRSRLDGQTREDQYNREVRNLTNSLTNLRSNFNRRNDWWVARNDMVRVLNAATNVNSLMISREARGGLNRQWTRLRRNIDQLAVAFNLPAVGANYSEIQPSIPNYGDGNGRACNITGTYRGWTNSGESELSISNGSATIRNVNSNVLYTGRCINDILYFEWGAFNLERNNRGLTTIEIGNTQNRSTYRRVSGSAENYPTYPNNNPNYPNYPNNNPNYPNQNYPVQGNVPSWAVGVFRGMTDSGESELVINSDGSAVARSLTNNTVFNGRYDNDVLTFDWGSYRLVRENGGIRTVEVGNRGTRTSYRRVQ